MAELFGQGKKPESRQEQPFVKDVWFMRPEYDGFPGVEEMRAKERARRAAKAPMLEENRLFDPADKLFKGQDGKDYRTTAGLDAADLRYRAQMGLTEKLLLKPGQGKGFPQTVEVGGVTKVMSDALPVSPIARPRTPRQ